MGRQPSAVMGEAPVVTGAAVARAVGSKKKVQTKKVDTAAIRTQLKTERETLRSYKADLTEAKKVQREVIRDCKEQMKAAEKQMKGAEREVTKQQKVIDKLSAKLG